MQANPAAILINEPKALAVSVSALVVDPRGGAEVNYTWSLCPLPSSLACSDFDDRLAALDAQDVATMRAMRAIGAAGQAPRRLEANGASSYAIPPFDLVQQSMALYGKDITADLLPYYLKRDPLSVLSGVWPTVILEVRSQLGDVLTVQKRLVVALQDWSLLAPVLRQRYGVVACQGDAQPPNCVPLAPQTANTNPDLLQVLWRPESTDAAAASPIDPAAPPLPVEAGARLVLSPKFSQASFETYQALRGSAQDGALQVQQRQEELSVSWFGDSGSFNNKLTWPKFTGGLDTVYQAPDQIPSRQDGLVTLWLVGRDQRGGTVWRSVRLRIIPQNGRAAGR